MQNASCFDTTSDYEVFAYLDGVKIDKRKIAIKKFGADGSFAAILHLGTLSPKTWKLSVSLRYLHSGIFINMSEPAIISIVIIIITIILLHVNR